MNTWQTALNFLTAVAALGSLYGLHRLCLWLEAKGHLYYIHKKPRGGFASSFVALQKIVEPQSQHVFQIKEEASSDDSEPAGDDPRQAQLHSSEPLP